MANEDIKKEIEEHLSRAMQLQKEVESLADKIRDELEKLKALSLKAEEVPPEIPVEEKRGVEEMPEVEIEAPKAEAPEFEAPEAEAPEIEPEGAGVDFRKELEKVKKIKEMLGRTEEVEPEIEKEKIEEVSEEIKEEKIEEAAPPLEIEEPSAEPEVSFEAGEGAEPAEAPPSEKEIEVAIGEESLPEAEKAPEIEEKGAFESPPLEKEPEISLEEPRPEEKPPEVEEQPPADVPPVEKEPEVPVEKGAEVEESETMQTMFSGRWKKHWQEKPQPEPGEEEAPDIHEKETVAAPAPEEKTEETIPQEAPPEVSVEPEVEVEPAAEIKPEMEVEPGAAEVKPEMEMEPAVGEGEIGPPRGRRASDFLEVLEKVKKTEPEEGGEVFYYEYNERIIVDSECIINELVRHLEEGKKLYVKLAQTESPKDQFFVKQEIIRHQEALRGNVEIAAKLLEKENSSMPHHTSEVINEGSLKEMLENLSMQNWSNQDDFTFFDEYANKIKSAFDARTEPKVDYLKSILTELGIQ